MYNVQIYTDGACSGNPGIGGYAGILKYGDKEKTISGYDHHTTNNKMELMAIIASVQALKKPCNVTVYTDSQYACMGWKSLNSWLAKDKLPNRELWQMLSNAEIKGKHKIELVKVKGHDGDVMNERCDKIAKTEIIKCRHLMFDGRLTDIDSYSFVNT